MIGCVASTNRLRRENQTRNLEESTRGLPLRLLILTLFWAAFKRSGIVFHIDRTIASLGPRMRSQADRMDRVCFPAIPDNR